MLIAPKARPLLMAFALCVGVLGGIAPAGAQPAPLGTVEALVGTAVVTRQATGEALPLTVGAELFEADRVRTYVGARLRLRLRDGSVLTCGEATGLILDPALYAPARDSQSYVVSTADGVTYTAATVVVATGSFQFPKPSPFTGA